MVRSGVDWIGLWLFVRNGLIGRMDGGKYVIWTSPWTRILTLRV